MKKLVLYSTILLLIFSISSCKKSRQEKIHEFQETLTKADTTEMLKIADDAMAKLKQNDAESVIATLYSYNEEENTVEPLSQKEKEQYRRTFKFFPVQKYSRKYYSFQLEGCNDVKYEITFDTLTEAKTAFMFNPVRIDGRWYLTVKTEDENIDESKR